MKILIAFDGSDSSVAALLDLRRAGLPLNAQVEVLSVADVFVPPPADDTVSGYVPPGVRLAHEHAQRALEQARRLAESAAERITKLFPSWEVRAQAHADSPAWAIIRRSDEWKPDLIVVGSLGRTAVGGRLVLGSVSQRVLYEARASVRIARGREHVDESPVRIVIGADGSPDSQAVVDVVAARVWPKGSEVQLITVVDAVVSLTAGRGSPADRSWVGTGDEGPLSEVRAAFEPLAQKLRDAGLGASVVLKRGDPKRVLVEDAERWGADSIFVGVRGMRRIERLLLGSVAATVAARAHCSVEVTRRRSRERVEEARSES